MIERQRDRRLTRQRLTYGFAIVNISTTKSATVSEVELKGGTNPDSHP